MGFESTAVNEVQVIISQLTNLTTLSEGQVIISQLTNLGNNGNNTDNTILFTTFSTEMIFCGIKNICDHSSRLYVLM